MPAIPSYMHTWFLHICAYQWSGLNVYRQLSFKSEPNINHYSIKV